MVNQFTHDSICIHPFSDSAMAYTYDQETGAALVDEGTRSIYPEFLLSESDADEFNNMLHEEKEFAVPHSMMICHMDDRIFGVQLVLGFKRDKFDGEDELIEKYDEAEGYKELDEWISNASPRRMSLIGNTGEEEGAKCDWTYFYDPVTTIYH